MKMIKNRSFKRVVATVLLIGGLIYYASASALNIANTPLFLGAGVPPNVFFTLDDSGSMDWEFSTLTNLWETNYYDQDSGSNPTTNYYLVAGNTWMGVVGGTDNNAFQYYFSNPTSSGNVYGSGVCGVTINSSGGASNYNGTLFSCAWPETTTNTTLYHDVLRDNVSYNPSSPSASPFVLRDWRVFSSSANTLYYDPNRNYEPWSGVTTAVPSGCSGVTAPNACWTAARSNPQSGTTGYSTTQNLSAHDFVYTVWSDTKGFSGTKPARGVNINMTDSSNSSVDLWDAYTLCRIPKDTSQILMTSYTTSACPPLANKPVKAANGKPPAAYAQCWATPTDYSSNYYPGRLLVAATGSTITLSDSDTNNVCMKGRTIDQVKQNIANWYQYSRKRQLVAKGAIGKVITSFSGFRYGISVINCWKSGVNNCNSNIFITMPTAPNGPYDTQNALLLNNLYSFNWSGQGTPLQAGLDRAGQYYKGSLAGYTSSLSPPSAAGGSPILSAANGGMCQQNFSLLMTDGFWNGTFSPSYSVNNVDGDGYNNTVADVAYYYYKNNLIPAWSTSANWKVPAMILNTPPDIESPFMFPHMVTFTVAFGAEGYLNYPSTNPNGWPEEVNPLNEKGNSSYQWGNPTTGDNTPAKIDDLWHAAYNSRGDFFSARSPNELLQGLQSALSAVSARTGSATAVSMNSGFITNSRTATSYIAKFNSGDWTGDLLAARINSNGTFNITAPLWETVITTSEFAKQSPASRKIFTLNGANGVEFLWANLNATQQGYLNTNSITGVADAKGSARLDFLRGKGVASADNDWRLNNNFRIRQSMLGDIINSDPFFVDYGSMGVVYIGANDGMVHAFDASNGKELFAYIPNAVFPKLNALADNGYTHRYYVDGSVVVKNIGNKKILVGTLRGGGQSVFALDVTDPINFGANNVLWEYSHNDLGYTFSKPTIVKLGDKWAVILGNGYNNTEDDGSASTTGRAALYILKLESTSKNGELLTPTPLYVGPNSPSAPNGLATPAVIFDTNNPPAAKYAYAGDLQGNLWKFDLSTGAASASVAYGGKALFTAKSSSAGNPAQPITARPEVDVHPSLDGYLVYFGTGKYIETNDNQNLGQNTQTIYAVWDRDNPNISVLLPQTRAHLLQQKILDSVSGYYVTTDTAINWHYDANAASPTNPLSSESPLNYLGWYIDLAYPATAPANHGEKQVTNGLLLDKKIIFNTLIPSVDICEAGGTSNTIILDAINGGRLETSPFKGINKVKYDLDGDGKLDDVTVSSQPSSMGILSEPKVVDKLDTGEQYIASLGSSGQPASAEIDLSQRTIGRRFWRQLQQ